jgi:hypothetical protein
MWSDRRVSSAFRPAAAMLRTVVAAPQRVHTIVQGLRAAR